MKLAVILFKTNTLASGEHPLMLRISQQQYRKYVALGLSCHPHLWDEKKNLPRKKHPNRDYLEAIIAHKLAAYHAKMLEMRAEDVPLTPQTLARAVEAPKQARELFPFLEELVERFERSGQVGNASVYKDMRRSIKQFCTGPSLLFSEIDLRWLNQYEVFLRSRGLAESGKETVLPLSPPLRTQRASFPALRSSLYATDLCSGRSSYFMVCV